MLKTKNRPSRSLSHGDVTGDSNSKSTTSATTGLFGRELADVILESGIPAIMEDCIDWIEEHALDEEGLFRIPADPKELKKLRDMYDAAPKTHFDLTKENPSPHAVAALLKMYLREIPEPLLLYRFYETFIKVARNEDAPTRLRNLRMLIQGLPPVYRTVLLCLLKFLNNFSSHSANNKMTLANLATCWAPNLLRSKEESYEKVLREASLVNQVVTTLIEQISFIEVEKKNAMDKASYSAEQIPDFHPPPSTKPTFQSDGVIPAILNLQTRAERSHSSNSGSLSPVEPPRKDSLSDWKEAVTKDGRKYYYNTFTRQSSWTPPEVLNPESLPRSNSDDSTLAASKNKLSEKIEGNAPEQATTPKQEVPQVVEAPKAIETPKIVETPKAEAPKTATPTGYINPAKTNTVSVQQLRAMLDECGVDHSDCVTRADLVKKVMESFTVNLPPPLPPTPRKN